MQRRLLAGAVAVACELAPDDTHVVISARRAIAFMQYLKLLSRVAVQLLGSVG
ncbi:MAG: hypothetical protein ACRDRN_26220 [Sciscionella sp.]